VTVCLPLFIAGIALASPLKVGDVAPGFEVYGGKSVPLNSSSLKGKVLIIIYGENDVVDKKNLKIGCWINCRGMIHAAL
jgi:hypothetical protein